MTAGLLPMCADCVAWKAIGEGGRQHAGYGRCQVNDSVRGAVDRCEAFVPFTQLAHRKPAPAPSPQLPLFVLLLVVCLFGTGCTSPTEPTFPSSAAFLGGSIIERLGNLAQWFGPQAIAWTNAGIGSNTSAQMLARVRRDVPDGSAFCVIYGGINDFGAGASPAFVAANYDALADSLAARGIAPVFATVLPTGAEFRPDLPSLNAQIRELDAKVREIAARRRIPLADAAPLFAGSDGYSPAELLDADHVHLSEAGKRIFTGAVAQALHTYRLTP